MSTKCNVSPLFPRAIAGTGMGFMGLLALALGLIASLGVGNATAKDYQVALCSKTYGSASEIDRSRLNSGLIDFRDRCLAGGGVEMRIIPSAKGSAGDGASATVFWTAPAGSSLSNLTLEGDFKDHGYLAARMNVFGSGRTEYRPTQLPVPGNRTYRFDTALNDGLGFSALPDTGFKTAALKLSCNPVPARVDRCSLNKADARAIAKNIVFTVRDYTSPEVTMSSKLFGEVTTGERKAITIESSDQGSGILERVITVNGEELTGQDSYLDYSRNCSIEKGIATKMAPCPADPERADRVMLDTWDDDSFQLGVNTVETTVTDYSGNSTTVTEEILVKPADVEIESPEVIDGGEIPVVEGEVEGENTSNAEIQVLAWDAPDSEWVPVGRSTSRSNGSFRAPLKGLSEVAPDSVRSTKASKCKKAKKAKKGKRMKPCRKVIRSYKVKARVVEAEKVWAGGESKVKEVKTRKVR